MKPSKGVSLMHPTDEELKEFHWHCAVMRATGATVIVQTKKDVFGFTAAVSVIRNKKCYQFSDPDWKVITKQLATLVNSYAIS